MKGGLLCDGELLTGMGASDVMYGVAERPRESLGKSCSGFTPLPGSSLICSGSSDPGSTTGVGPLPQANLSSPEQTAFVLPGKH